MAIFRVKGREVLLFIYPAVPEKGGSCFGYFLQKKSSMVPCESKDSVPEIKTEEQAEKSPPVFSKKIYKKVYSDYFQVYFLIRKEKKCIWKPRVPPWAPL